MVGTEERDVRTRRSKDKLINKEGQKMLDGIKERGWTILNRSYGEAREVGRA